VLQGTQPVAPGLVLKKKKWFKDKLKIRVRVRSALGIMNIKKLH